MAMRRPRSLFARLLVLQLGVVVVLMGVFGLVVHVERNVAVARLVAERWAPALRHAAGWPGSAPDPARALMRPDTPPEPRLLPPFLAPRMAALRDELRRRGVVVDDATLTRTEYAVVLWLRVRSPDGAGTWLGLADAALLPGISGRFLGTLLLAVVFLAGVSWVFTRRLTRPLESLRERMGSYRPGEPVPPPVAAAATPEVAAIERAFAGLLQRFEQHERERGLLLAGVSHDLRGPLTRIRTAADLLPADAASAPWREAIVRNTLAADRLIEGFLDHVRAGELALDQTVDLAALARHAAAATGQGPDTLTVVAPPALLLASSHPLLIERLIANLLDNAFKHGRAPVELQVREEGARAVVEVLDHGPGLPPGQQAQLVQAFARGDAARGSPGTGLGLAIVARVVERMGGTLSFAPRGERHGVRVELPRRA